jgi:glycerate-2-kinase
VTGTVLEDREPSKTIVAFLKSRIREGREFNPTRVIVAGTGMTSKAVGARMHIMAKQDWHGLVITKWTERVWLVKSAQRRSHGQTAI